MHSHLPSSARWTIKVTPGCFDTPCLEGRASEVKCSPRSAKVCRPPAMCLTVVLYRVHPSPVLILLLSPTFSILTGTAECFYIAFAKREEESGSTCPPHIVSLSSFAYSQSFSCGVRRSQRQRWISRNSGDVIKKKKKR